MTTNTTPTIGHNLPTITDAQRAELSKIVVAADKTRATFVKLMEDMDWNNSDPTFRGVVRDEYIKLGFMKVAKLSEKDTMAVLDTKDKKRSAEHRTLHARFRAQWKALLDANGFEPVQKRGSKKRTEETPAPKPEATKPEATKPEATAPAPIPTNAVELYKREMELLAQQESAYKEARNRNKEIKNNEFENALKAFRAVLAKLAREAEAKRAEAEAKRLESAQIAGEAPANI